MSSLPYRPIPEYMRVGTDGNMVEQKVGSTLLARWRVKTYQYEDPPCYVTWEVEGGRTFAMCHDWTPGGGWLMSRWDYYRDYSVNLMLYLAGRSLPPGHMEIHEYRGLIHDLAISKSMLYSLLEFVESFGGNSAPIDDRVGELDLVVSDAQEFYLDHEFNEALVTAQKAMDTMKDIEALAVELKNEALFWVYLVEWLSVTGVALLSGTVVWFIMVQRRLYREVEVTRSHEL
jgi:hypothetical protein